MKSLLTLGRLPVGAIGVIAYGLMLYFIDRSIAGRKTRAMFRAGATFAGNFLLFIALSRMMPDGLPTGGAKLNFNQISVLIGLNINFLAFLYFFDDVLPTVWRPIWRLLSIAGCASLFFYAMHVATPNHKRAVEITKAALAIVAAAFVFFEAHRKGQGRPIAERWKKIVGVALALAAIGVYFNGFNFGYPKYYHRWDQYHYYMGAKYFPELGYKNLYKCAVVAQFDVGRLNYKLDRPFNGSFHRSLSVDMRAEMRDPDKKIRDLPGENLLVPVGDLIDNKDTTEGDKCRDAFSKERWEEYKGDVAFYRIVSGKGYWTDMQKDHGFNPPPVWTLAGKWLADINPASVSYLQFLASIDILYIIGMFIALWWGFGWRVFAVGAIFWGCQSSAPFYWTGGAFLRQDWLFFSVLSVACLRKKHFKIAGASLVYAGLLRIFPGLVVVGTLVPTIAYAFKHRKMHRDHLQMLIGGTMAAAVLLVASTAMSQRPNTPFYAPYKLFYEHTIETHDKTPLTNHMGLRVMIGHKFLDVTYPGALMSEQEREQALAKAKEDPLHVPPPAKYGIAIAKGKSSGQMQYTRDNKKLDPFEDWKRMRNERYEKLKPFAYTIMIGTLLFFVYVVRRMKSLWVAQCLGQVFIIIGSQLTCYYYSFMILAAPLIKLRRQIELALFALAAVTQIIWLFSYWNDNKYTLLTIASLIFCYVMIGMFARPFGSASEKKTKARPRKPARAT